MLAARRVGHRAGPVKDRVVGRGFDPGDGLVLALDEIRGGIRQGDQQAKAVAHVESTVKIDRSLPVLDPHQPSVRTIETRRHASFSSTTVCPAGRALLAGSFTSGVSLPRLPFGIRRSQVGHDCQAAWRCHLERNLQPGVITMITQSERQGRAALLRIDSTDAPEIDSFVFATAYTARRGSPREPPETGGKPGFVPAGPGSQTGAHHRAEGIHAQARYVILADQRLDRARLRLAVQGPAFSTLIQLTIPGGLCREPRVTILCGINYGISWSAYSYPIRTQSMSLMPRHHR